MALSNTYVSAVPQSSQQVSNSQNSIEGNFQDIYTLLAINHIPFNTADTFGRHTYVNYVEQGSDPATLSTEMALYSKSVNNDTNGAELFYRYPNSGNVVQLTGVTSTSSGGTSTALGGTFYADGAVYLGYPSSGYWQYLSNNVLFMSFIISNAVGASSPTTSPYTFYFPSGTYSNGAIVPAFTQTPFNIQVTSAFPASQGNLGTNVNYAATAVSSTTGTMYYNPTSLTTSAGVNLVIVTAIGI